MSLPDYTADHVRREDCFAPEFRSYSAAIYADGVYVGRATVSPELAEHLDPENYSIDYWTDQELRRHIESLEILAEDCDELLVAAVEAIRAYR